MLFQVRDIHGYNFGNFDFPVLPTVGCAVRIPANESNDPDECHHLPIVAVVIYPTATNVHPILYVDAVLLKASGKCIDGRVNVLRTK